LNNGVLCVLLSTPPLSCRVFYFGAGDDNISHIHPVFSLSSSYGHLMLV
uniref:Ovule protein n=1 Tax=Hydatigena taeniaeformis TaxID=6205 RepID=A0A0R3X6L2_HYDTA